MNLALTRSGVTGHSLWRNFGKQTFQIYSHSFGSGVVARGRLVCTSPSPVSFNVALFAHLKLICCTWFQQKDFQRSPDRISLFP